MPNVKYLVFVLSTHGDERPEKEKDDNLYYQHYFYTKDGQVKTQDLMTMINHIEEIKNKMKLFFIQACRCRATNTELDNQDPGFNVPITSTKQLSPDVSPTTIENKEAGYNPPKSTKGTDHTDARGYMPPEKIDPPFERIPHCDDCGVVFASTAGKYAYSKKNSEDEGGWMIRALYSTLHEYQKEDGVRDVHIIDVLGRINRKVSEKEAVFLISDFDSDDSVVGKCISHLSMLKDELIMELKKENKDSMDELIALKQQVIELQGRVVQEIKLGGEPKKTMINDIIIVRDKVEGKINGLVDTKAQSCFYHNLAFEDKDMTLYKSKTKSGVE
ncbi:CASP2 [Mytilus edulis]|uniref:CASP2 n=1 Tax=Mytilus edulis TaxID=6550 RepID=A0A8S3RVR4_MYTED|nr:CASP2 [Mytilus edulis]